MTDFFVRCVLLVLRMKILRLGRVKTLPYNEIIGEAALAPRIYEGGGPKGRGESGGEADTIIVNCQLSTVHSSLQLRPSRTGRSGRLRRRSSGPPRNDRFGGLFSWNNGSINEMKNGIAGGAAIPFFRISVSVGYVAHQEYLPRFLGLAMRRIRPTIPAADRPSRTRTSVRGNSSPVAGLVVAGMIWDSV